MSALDLAACGHATAVLASQTIKILAVCGIAGAGLVTVLPRFCRVRWIIFAPIAGLAAITLVSLPLSLAGIPAGRYAWPLFVVLGLVSAGMIARAVNFARPVRRWRMTFAYLRHTGIWLALGFVSVAALSANMITLGGKNPVTAVWGTTDFGAYWAVGDYLQDHGASPATYALQEQYHAADISDHLQKHARLGCMTTIAFVGRIVAPGELYTILNALTVATLCLLLALALALAEKERLWRSTAWLLLICYPFLYFLLYFNYQSQAFSVLLVVAGLLVAEIGRFAAREHILGASVGAGLFWGAALLHYPSSFLAPGIYLLTQFFRRPLRESWRVTAVVGLTGLICAGYYLPQTLRELAWLQHSTALPGWNWNRLVDVQELLGLRSLQNFLPMPPADLTENLGAWGLTGMVLVALWYHLRRGALPLVSLALLGSTALLAGSAYLKFRLHVPNATHGFAKAFSQYAPFLLVFVVAGALAVNPHRRKQMQRIAVIVVFFFAVIQCLELRHWRRPPWYGPELVRLVERHLHDNVAMEFDPGMLDKVIDPLLKDDRRWIHTANGPRLRFTESSNRDAWPDSSVIDQEGDYLAVFLQK